ncbi:MAG: hypothetical protein ABWZ52_01185 [Acidimicrobiales bacterium]
MHLLYDLDDVPGRVYEIYIRHRVAHAPTSGMIGWMSWPGAAEFSID